MSQALCKPWKFLTELGLIKVPVLDELRSKLLQSRREPLKGGRYHANWNFSKLEPVPRGQKKRKSFVTRLKKKRRNMKINLPLLTSALLSSELFFNVKTYGTNDISSHTAHTCVYTLNQKDVLALKIGPFRWVKYSPIFGSNLAPLNQDQYSPIS